MAMESVLKALEERIEELVKAYRGATERATELETRVATLEDEILEFEVKLEGSTGAGERVTELETQRDELAARLEKVLGLIDGVLDKDRD
jgi:predicted  nucleic acid-binding Zn-ribbon protein